MNRNEYNGWTNYETWLVNLWLDNDGASEYLRELCADSYSSLDAFDEVQFGVCIRDYVEEAYLEAIPTYGMVADLINGAMSEVNWQEIASHYADDLPEKETA